MTSDIKGNNSLTKECANDNKDNGLMFSFAELSVLRRSVRGETVTQENSGLSVSDWKSFMMRLGYDDIPCAIAS